MSRMRFDSKRIDNQQIQPAQPLAGVVRNEIAIRDISKPADPKCSNRQLAVNHFDRFYVETKGVERTRDRVRLDARLGRISTWYKCIFIDATQALPRNLARIACDCSILHHYRPDVVESEAVIRMSVSKQHGVEPGDS